MNLDRVEKKALCVYLCIGDPSFDASLELALTVLEAGADLLELGVPFSDPTADGPILARASRRALAAGATLVRVLEFADALRERTPAPLVLFTYYNPVFVTGEARVANMIAAAGLDGVIVVDLPPEEAQNLRNTCADRGVGVMPLVTPTANADRIEVIQRLSAPPLGAPRGFVYAVSTTGVTGTSATDLSTMSRGADMLRLTFGMPVMLGFGLDSAERVRIAADRRGPGPDGIVVGTAVAQ
ncbi:MAG TPA: tryptophan synthase subunit alpha, partial [Polyangium sp.]|nr:tryptophan synthase subunit alpha [Polyangium sp.]